MSSSLLTKPVLAASLVATSLLYISYLWLQSRQRDQEENSGLPTQSSSSQDQSSAETELQLDQVQERLHSIRRTRLDTLEEEPVQAEPEPVEQVVEAVEEKKKTKKVPVYFGSTDIRYRHLETNHQEFVEEIVVKEEKQNTETATEQVVEVTPVTEDSVVEAEEDFEKPVEVSEIQVEDHKMTVEVSEAAPIPVPDVVSALNDPLCGSGGATPPGSDYSSSPVKSESAVSSKSSCEWSDLIEQDEKELQEFRLDTRELTCKLSGLEIGSGRSNDSGVASPSEEGESTERARSKGSKSRTQSGEDPGLGGSEQGDEVGAENSLEDCQLLAYHFHIPETLCGKLIGVEGTFINELKKDCRVNIHLREISSEEKKRKKLRQRRDYSSRRKGNYFEEPTFLKLCAIEGTRTNIDRCLNKLKKKFYQNPEVTFDQVNMTKSVARTIHNGNLSLGFAEGVMHDVFVSSIVGGGHIFLQQPCHPTYFALERLDQCMNNTYSQFNCPGIPQPVILNSVCAAPCDGGWFRCQVVSHDEETGSCDVKFLDYGGYSSLPVDSLKQIRTDFLSLPFQAIECYLANIQPEDDQNVSAFVLEELVSGQVVQARMIGTNDQGVPMVHLYRAVNGATTMVNREMVDRECATWLDTTIVKLDSPLDHPSTSMWSNLGNFQNRNLGPYACDQINTIYFVPDNDLLDPSLSLSLEADVSLEQPWEAPGLGCSTPLSDHDDYLHL